MPEIKDLTGQRFNWLTVDGFAYKDKHNKGHWQRRCKCGAAVVVETHQLKSGKTKSCGCWKNEFHSKRLKTHGGNPPRLHWVWAGIIQRCTNPNNAGYSRYGGRGIQVCDEWRNSFKAFRDWALANGYKDGLSIDRRNNDGNYCPENCRWTDRRTQNNNSSHNHKITYNGKTQTVTEWAKELKTDTATIRRRSER